jgi:hypothetical protein
MKGPRACKTGARVYQRQVKRQLSGEIELVRQFHSNNWLETVPGKAWFTILRMYGPLEPWIKKTWRPSEIELVK